MDSLITTRAAILMVLTGLYLGAPSARAQTAAGGARDAALAGASSSATHSADLWSEANPAGWSRLGAVSAAMHVAQLYGLEELRLGAAQAAFLIRKTSIVAGVRTFGYEAYRETVATLGAARIVRWGTHRPLHVGIRFRSHHAAVRSYGSASATAVSAGVIMPIAQSTHLGLSAENLLVFSGSLKRDLPRRLYAGLSISSGSVSLLASASKDVRTPPAARLGIEVRLVEALALRAGYSLAPPRFASGIGLRLLPLTVDIAAERHFVLGWTPSCSVGVEW